MFGRNIFYWDTQFTNSVILFGLVTYFKELFFTANWWDLVNWLCIWTAGKEEAKRYRICSTLVGCSVYNTSIHQRCFGEMYFIRMHKFINSWFPCLVSSMDYFPMQHGGPWSVGSTWLSLITGVGLKRRYI